jgi:competence protein ComEA
MQTAEPTPAAAPRLQPKTLVYVAGAVVHPGVYAVAAGARAADALAKAGGATHDADLVAVNLAAKLSDGEELAVPRRGDPPAATPRSRRDGDSHRGGRRHRRSRHSPAPDAGPADGPRAAELINVNTAGEEQLADLPGIGPALAERIVEFRALNGPFTSVDGLADVAGITPSHLDELETLVTVGR